MTIQDQFTQYCRIPTAKRSEGREERSARIIGLYLNNYVSAYPKVCYDSFRDYLTSAPISQSSKYLLKTTLGRFLLVYGYINESDMKILNKLFWMPVKNWSDQSLSVTDVEKIIQESRRASSAFYRIRNQAIFALLCSVGLRIGQVCSLQTKNVKIADDQSIEVRVAKEKDVRMNENINYSLKVIPPDFNIGKYTFRDLFVPYYEERLKIKYPVEQFFLAWKFLDAIKLSEDNAGFLVRTIARRAGYDEVTPHSFRHYVGNKIANEQGIYEAAVILDHEKIETTQRYINKQTADTRRILEISGKVK